MSSTESHSQATYTDLLSKLPEELRRNIFNCALASTHIILEPSVIPKSFMAVQRTRAALSAVNKSIRASAYESQRLEGELISKLKSESPEAYSIYSREPGFNARSTLVLFNPASWLTSVISNARGGEGGQQASGLPDWSSFWGDYGYVEKVLITGAIAKPSEVPFEEFASRATGFSSSPLSTGRILSRCGQNWEVLADHMKADKTILSNSTAACWWPQQLAAVEAKLFKSMSTGTGSTPMHHYTSAGVVRVAQNRKWAFCQHSAGSQEQAVNKDIDAKDVRYYLHTPAPVSEAVLTSALTRVSTSLATWYVQGAAEEDEEEGSDEEEARVSITHLVEDVIQRAVTQYASTLTRGRQRPMGINFNLPFPTDEWDLASFRTFLRDLRTEAEDQLVRNRQKTKFPGTNRDYIGLDWIGSADPCDVCGTK